MVIILDVLCPDRDAPDVRKEESQRTEKPVVVDKQKVTRLQVINIKGDIVDVEN